MPPKHRSLHAKVRKMAGDDHSDYNEFLNYCSSPEVLNECFKVAVEKLLPGFGNDFEVRAKVHGGAYGEADAGAHEEIAYIAWTPGTINAGGNIDMGRGGANVPWGHKVTALPALSESERAKVDAAFAVLLERLGLEAVGAPGLKLVTTASGG